ncbi:ABC transporter substrate-binding protein [Pseudothermotoga sp. U03pept]|uniref:ABC transporter substrate-binding protein n=1 Tax=Pseudothermotoga sp. U03pept TaxID=3447012 RepID=UPI0030B4817B
MKMLLILVLLVSVSVFSFNVLVPAGPTVVSVVGLLEGRVTSEVPLKIDFWRTLDQVNAQITAKSVDIVILPVSIGTTLYLKNVDLRLAAVTLWSGFYVVTKDLQLGSLEDLNGKEIYTPQGKGQTGDVLTRFLIGRYNLSNTSIKYAVQNEIVALMSAGKVKIAVLPEPFVTLAVKNASASIAFDLQEIWSKLTGKPAQLPITGVFVRGDLLEKSEQLLFALEALKRSIDYAMQNKREVSELSAKYLGGMNPAVIEQALERTIYRYNSAKEKKEEIIFYLSVVNQIEPEAVPRVPDDDFFAF